MTYELTNEEKAAIVEQHLKSVSYSLYNSQLDLIEAQSVSSPDNDSIAGINARIIDLNSKVSALNAELDSLSA